MELTYIEIQAGESALLAEWLSSEIWSNHSWYGERPEKPKYEDAQKFSKKILSDDKDAKVFWIILDGMQKAGIIRLEDLSDKTPLFDIRLLSQYRGKGIGRKALKWLTERIFTTMPDKIRIEGQTRHDNAAMRKVLRECGYVKEAHYRKAWPAGTGNYVDSVGYAILREDWENNKTTAVKWDDERG